MSESFDPYHKWLGIPPDQRPIDYYRLLGVQTFEADPDVIEQAAERQMTHVQKQQTGQHSAISQRLLNEIATAKICLLVAEKRAAYDAKLRTLQASEPVEFFPPIAALPSRANSVSPRRSPAWLVPAIVSGIGIAAVSLVAWGFMLSSGGTEVAEHSGDAAPSEATRQIEPSGDATGNPTSQPKSSDSGVTEASRLDRKVETTTLRPAPPPAPSPTSPQAEAPLEQPLGVSEPPPSPAPVIAAPPTLAPSAGEPVIATPADDPATTDPRSQEKPTDPASQDKRLAIPSQDQQDASRKLIRELFADEWTNAKTQVQLVALARKLQDLAAESPNDPASQFVLWADAKALTIEAGDPRLALKLVDLIAASFAVDPLEEQLKTLQQAAEQIRSTTGNKELAAAALDVADTAAAADEFDAADRAAQFAITAARKARDTVLIKQAVDRQKEVEFQKSTYEAVRLAFAALKENPDDPDANATAGKHLCFTKQEWDRGLAMLAKGSNVQLAAIAKLDLGRPEESVQQVELADAWYDLAMAAPEGEKRGFRSRAAHWYRAAESRLSGLGKLKVQKRLSEIGDVPIAAVERPAASSPAREPAVKNPGTPQLPGDPPIVCQLLEAKRRPDGLEEGTIPFTGPSQNGRSGANGFLVEAATGWEKSGTVWSCTFRRGGTARGIQFIHPFGRGHILVTVGSTELYVASPATWSKYVEAGGQALPLQKSPDFQEVFALGEEPHHLASVLLPTGDFHFYLDQKLIAVGKVPGAQALQLVPEFKGDNIPTVLSAGQCGVIIGPRDGGVNRAENVAFGRIGDVAKTPPESGDGEP